MTQTLDTSTPAVAQDQFVDADGFHIRYLESGQGKPLIWLPGAGGLHGLPPTTAMLGATHRMIGLELPGFGTSPANTRSQTAQDLARTVLAVADALGLDAFDVLGTSFGAKVALELGLLAPERVGAIVLESPAAIRPEDHQPPVGLPPEEMQRRFRAHPERPSTSLMAQTPEIQAKQWALVTRILGPNRDAVWEGKLGGLQVPTLVLFGTQDGVISPEIGRVYPGLIPNCHLVFVYRAAHDIQADRPEAFAEVVGDFLERHEAFVVSLKNTLIHP